MQVMDVLSPRVIEGTTRCKNLGTAFQNQTNIKLIFDGLPLPCPKTGMVEIILKERKTDNGISEKNGNESK